METVRFKIYPSFGNSYIVSVDFPNEENDLETFMETWVEDNLKNVEKYELYDLIRK